MELIVGIAIIFILLLCMGASVSFIATLALILIGIFVVFMNVFFVYASVLLLTGKRKNGRYLRSEKSEKTKVPYAVYLIDETEYKNLMPLEVLFKNKIYHTEKDVPIVVNQKKNCCFDNNARICCVLGVLVSLFLLIEMIILITGNNIL